MTFRKLLLAVAFGACVVFTAWIIDLDRAGMIGWSITGMMVCLMLPVERFDKSTIIELMKAWKGVKSEKEKGGGDGV
jgi:hypothetical protein